MKVFLKLRCHGDNLVEFGNKQLNYEILINIYIFIYLFFQITRSKLDKNRTGEISLDEFKNIFGSISEVDFNHLEVGKLAPPTKEQSELLSYMYSMCDIVRHAGFSVLEMFSGFDRNGSGEISVSEFCSLLKVILGHSVDKKIVYKIMSSIDIDGGKDITVQEISVFIYYVWKAELKEITNRIYLDTTLDDNTLNNLIKEKEDIKNAILRNFPRNWRDKISENKIESAFTNLYEQGLATGFSPNNLKSLKLSHGVSSSPNSKSKATAESFQSQRPTTGSPSKSKTNGKFAKNGGQFKMYKIAKEMSSIPYREGRVLSTLPNVKNLNDAKDIYNRGELVDMFNKFSTTL